MRSLATQWKSTRRGLTNLLVTLVTGGVIAILTPGCDSGAPTAKPGEPGGGPNMDDAKAVKDVAKKAVKPEDDSIAAKRAKRKGSE